MRKFKTLNHKDQTVDLMQDNISQVFDQILPKEILDGRLLKNIALSDSGTNVIEHGLGRELIGWIPVRSRDGFCVCIDLQDSSPMTDKFLYLQSIAICEVDFWVF